MDYNITIRPKDGKFQAIVSYKDLRGKWHQKSKQGLLTKRAAKRCADEIIDTLKATPGIRQKPQMDGITLGEFAELFIAEQSSMLRPTTITTYRVMLRYFNELIDLPITEITHSDILAIINTTHLKTSTLQTYLAKLRRVFGYARKPYQLISKLPTDDIHIKSNRKTKTVTALTQTELTDFLASIHKPVLLVACSLAGYTGLRQSEVIGLKWDDVDLQKRLLSVTAQITPGNYRTKKRTPLKSSNSYRTVPIPERLVHILAQWRPHSPGSHVVGDQLSHHQIRNALAGMRVPFSFHALRHTYATLLIANGLDIKTVSALIGDDMKTVMDTYVHYTDEMRSRAQSDIERIFG